MISYQYQILRYIPDQINEEFSNLGIVLFNKERKYLRGHFVHRVSRVSSFFHGIDARFVVSSLSNIEIGINDISRNLKEGLSLELPENIYEITNSLLPKDDSSLQFTEIKKGLDTDLTNAFNSLVERFLYKYDVTKDDGEIRND